MRQQFSILRFPSHVAILFGLVIVLVVASLIGGLQTYLAPCALPLVLVALLLPLRDLLTWVDEAVRKFRAVPEPGLQPAVDQLCLEMKILPPPMLCRSPTRCGMVTVGGLRRRLIIADDAAVAWLTQSLASSNPEDAAAARATLGHELQHVAQRDTLWLAWAEKLIASLFKWSVWVLVVTTGFVIFLARFALPVFDMIAKPGFALQVAQGSPEMADLVTAMLPPAAETARVVELARGFNYGLPLLAIMTTVLPIVLASAVLRAVVWQRMTRVREFYADAGMARLVSVATARKALVSLAAAASLMPAAPAPKSQRDSGWQRVLGFSFHPPLKSRLQALANPAPALTDWRSNGATIGLTVFLLNMLLAGGFSLSIVGAWPMHVAVAVIVGTTTMLMTPLFGSDMDWPELWRRTWRTGALALGVGLLWLVMNAALGFVLLLLAPDLTARLVEFSVRGQFGLQSTIPDLTSGNIQAILWTGLANLIVIGVAGSGVTMLALAVDFRARRSAAAWVADPRAYVWISGIVTALSLALMSVLTALVYGLSGRVGETVVLTGMPLSVAAVLAFMLARLPRAKAVPA